MGIMEEEDHIIPIPPIPPIPLPSADRLPQMSHHAVRHKLPLRDGDFGISLTGDVAGAQFLAK